MSEIVPKCIEDLGFRMAITNKGHLVPCPQMATPHGYRDPIISELMKKTKLSDYDSIEKIISQPEWIQYFENLKKNIAPTACFYYCNKTNNYRGTHSRKIMFAIAPNSEVGKANNNGY